jgi:hypothetical protein
MHFSFACTFRDWTRDASEPTTGSCVRVGPLLSESQTARLGIVMAMCVAVYGVLGTAADAKGSVLFAQFLFLCADILESQDAVG